jgi:type IV fimbrial biogenesis protein FimT
MKSPQNDGFTLIELMVTVALVAVIVTIAAPSYQQFIIDSRMTSQTNDFLTHLQFARSEAVKRNTTVTMCKSANSTACAGSGTWAQGWIVFTDDAATGVVPGTDAILRVHGPLSDASTLVGQGAVASLVTYRPNGQPAQFGQFDLCSSDTTRPGRDIILSLTGSAHSVTNTPPLTC